MKSVDFSSVKHAISPVDFFQNVMREEPTLVGASIRYNTCPSCGKSENAGSIRVSVSKMGWNCFSCGEKGDVIRAAELYWGVSTVEAAIQLMNGRKDFIPAKVSVSARTERDDSAINQVIQAFKIAPKHENNLVIGYLAQRGINEELFLNAQERGLIFTLPDSPSEAARWLTKHIGRDLLEKAGMWKKDSRAPAIAYRPLAFIAESGSSIEFRLIGPVKDGDIKVIRYGSVSPWIWHGEKNVMVTEGAIDLMSAIALGSKRTIVGLPGCENYDLSWFDQYKGQHILLALDSDGPGQMASARLNERLVDAGFTVSTHQLPNNCKDLNDQLMAA